MKAENLLFTGTRTGRLRSSHSYGFVLALVVFSFVFIAVAPDATWSRGLLVLIETTTLIVALWTSGLRPPRLGVWLLLLLGLVAAVGSVAVEGDHARGATGIMNVTLLVGACMAVAIGVTDQQEVNRQSIIGAVTVYLALGILFAFAYDAAAVLSDSYFFAQGTDGTPSIRLYFSFVTLATLGYGDFTPAHSVGRTVAITEAILGQLYLVTVLAILVSNLGRPRH